jgi:hypothetical protein
MEAPIYQVTCWNNAEQSRTFSDPPIYRNYEVSASDPESAARLADAENLPNDFPSCGFGWRRHMVTPVEQ